MDLPQPAAVPVVLAAAVVPGGLLLRRRRRRHRPAPLPGSAGEHVLQARYGSTGRARSFYQRQVLDHLNQRMIQFIGRQELLFVGTADAAGACDCSIRCGPPGFVRVIDDRTLRYPEYRGNGVMGSLGNIHENAHVGLLFVDFQTSLIGLHVNGTARILDPPARPGPSAGGEGPRTERWVEVEVEEAYIHCAKHLPHLVKVPRKRAWGSDDPKRKGGDFFEAACEARPWSTPT
jgi:uncharacterized protein